MNIEIHKLQQAWSYIAVPAGHPLPQSPATVGASFVRRMDLCQVEPLIGIDANQVLEDIAEHGWAVWAVVVTAEVR